MGTKSTAKVSAACTSTPPLNIHLEMQALTFVKKSSCHTVLISMLTLLLFLSLSLLISRNNVFQDDRPKEEWRKDSTSDMAGTTFKNFCTGKTGDCGAWNEAE